MDKTLDWHMSRCCKASYKAVLTENNELLLRCEECGKCCAILEKL